MKNHNLKRNEVIVFKEYRLTSEYEKDAGNFQGFVNILNSDHVLSSVFACDLQFFVRALKRDGNFVDFLEFVKEKIEINIFDMLTLS